MDSGLNDECRNALQRLYFLSTGWGGLKEAISHLINCQEGAWCIDLWLGWELHVDRAARLRLACEGNRPLGLAGADPICVLAREAIRRPAGSSAVRSAMRHVLDCTEKDCTLLQWAFVQYLRGMNIVNHPVDHLEFTPEVRAKLEAAERSPR